MRLWTAALVATACSPPASFFLPLDPAAKSAVVMAQRISALHCEHILSAEAWDGEGPFKINLTGPDAGSAFSVTAAIFGQPLSAVGLSAGPLLLESPDPSRCMNPAGARYFHADRGGAFSATSDPGALGSCICFPRPPGPHCDEFQIEEVPLTGAFVGGGAFTTAIDGRSALVGLPFTQQLFRVFVGTSSSWAEEITPLPLGLPLGQVFRRGDGQLIFGGINGDLFSGSLGPPFTATRLASTGGSEGFNWIDGAKSATAPLDLVALAYQGLWVRYRPATGLVRLLDFPQPPTGLHANGTAYLGDGDAVAVDGTSTVVARLHDDVVTIEPVIPGSIERYTVIRQLPGFGLLIGSDHASLFVQRGGAWEPLADSGVGEEDVRALEPYNGGLVFSGGHGFLMQLLADGTPCPTVHVTSRGINGVAVLGSNLVLAHDAEPGQQLTMVVLRRK